MAKASSVRRSKRKASAPAAAAAEAVAESGSCTTRSKSRKLDNPTKEKNDAKEEKGDDANTQTTGKKGTGKPKDDRDYEDDAGNNHNNVPTFLSEQVFGNLDVADQIFSFLGVRELFNFTMTSQRYLKWLTYDRIVQSAMLGGGHAKTSVERLVPLVRNRQIWIPSPLRVLRLVNGKLCEHCRTFASNTVSKAFGVFYCSHDCLRVGLYQKRGPNTMAKTVGRNAKWDAFIQHHRVARIDCSNNAFVWLQPVQDSGGKPYGPLISKAQMETIMEEHGNCDAIEKTACLNALLEDLDKKQMEVDENAEANAKALVEAFENWAGEANKRIQAKADEQQEKTDKNNEARKQKTLVWIEALQKEVGNVPWKDALEEYEFVGDRKKVVKFRCPFVNDILSPLAQAPSKATKKMIKEVAGTILAKFDLIWSKNFHDFSFLSRQDAKSPSPAFDELLWLHFQPRVAELRPHLSVTTDVLHRGIEAKDGLRFALFRLFYREIEVAAVDGIMRSVETLDPNHPGHVAHVRQLAERLWATADGVNVRAASAWPYYDTARNRFSKLYQAAVERNRITDPRRFVNEIRWNPRHPLRSLIYGEESSEESGSDS